MNSPTTPTTPAAPAPGRPPRRLDQRSITAARLGLESIATACLQPAMFALIHRRLEDPSSWPSAQDCADMGRVAADMALAIRQRCASNVAQLLASEDGEAFLAQLAEEFARNPPSELGA